MPAITRTWLAFAAIGTGLIHFALVIGSPLPIGIVLAVFALAEFAWGVLTFARDGFPLPRLVLLGALLPVILWGALLATATLAESPAIASSPPFVPLAIATVFELFIAITVAVHLRTLSTQAPSMQDAAPKSPGGGRYLLGLLAGGLVVAALTTPALAATSTGPNSAPHPNFQLVLPEHSH